MTTTHRYQVNGTAVKIFANESNQPQSDAFDTGKALNTSQIAAQTNKSKKTIQRYEQSFNLKTFVFQHWHKALLKRAASSKTLHRIDIRPFVQTEVLQTLTYHFSPFSPSESILNKDHARKILYLKSLYPLIA